MDDYWEIGESVKVGNGRNEDGGSGGDGNEFAISNGCED